MDIQSLLNYSRDHNASDLHLSTSQPPVVRVKGELNKLKVNNLTAEDVQNMFDSISNEAQKLVFKKDLELDFSFEKDAHRYRVNAFNNLYGPCLAIRMINERIRDLKELMIPNVVEKFTHLKKGLVIVTGPTGSGKSTTLAAMIDHINKEQSKNIITIEDPIEYKFTPQKCLINQREVGSSTHSFSRALKSALREDPDIIMIGELRDLETIHLALSAAETGHVVFCTLHTTTAAKTVDRIIDVFPSGDKDMIRTMLSTSIEGIVCQALIPCKDKEDRIAAYEIMVSTPAIRNLIRENKLHQIPSMMQIGKKQGMIMMAQSITNLLEKNLISTEQSKEYLFNLREKNGDEDHEISSEYKDNSF